MSTLRLVRNNLAFLGVAEIATKLGGAVLYFFLARYLGPHDFGIYSVAVSFAAIFGLVSGLGIDSYVVKEVAREPGRARELLSDSMNLKLLGGTLAYLAAALLSFALGYDERTRTAIVIFSLTLYFSAFTNLFDAIFRGLQRMGYCALIIAGRSLITIALVLVLMGLGQDVHAIVSAHVVTGAVLAFLTYVLLVRQGHGRYFLSFNAGKSKTILSGGVPFIATGIVYLINAKADILLLSKLADIESVGIYDAANEIVLAILILPSLISQVLYPYLSQQFRHNRENLGRVVNFAMRVIVAVSVPASFGVVILAPKIIALCYGPKYASSAIVLQIMGAGLSIVFLRSIMGWVLAAIEKMDLMMWINVLNLVLNLVFNVVLITHYGYRGAAVATMAAMVFGTLTVLKAIKGVVHDLEGITALFLKPVLASLVMAGCLLTYPRLNVFVQAAGGAAVYGVVFAGLRGLSAADWSVLRRALPAVGR